MLVEHARNLIGIADASHAEYGKPGTHVVTLLSCSLRDTAIDIEVVEDTVLAQLHGPGRRRERTNCNYGLEPTFAHITDAAGMRVSARDDTGEVRAVERTDHPFFVATLYQPQLSSSPGSPHPLFQRLLAAAAQRAGG